LNSLYGLIDDRLRRLEQISGGSVRRPLADRPITALFLIHNMAAWDSVADVISAMKQDPAFDPVVASIDRKFPGESGFGHEDETHLRLEELGIRHIRIRELDREAVPDLMRAIGPDILFRQSHWDADVPPEFSSQNLSFTRLCYISYEMMNLGDHRHGGRDFVLDDDFHRRVWRVFCANSAEKELYRSNALLGGTNVVVTGHPKMARLTRGPEWWPSPRSNLKRIIWSPHHTLGKFGFGLFPACRDDMLAWLRGGEVEIVLAFHPALPSMADATLGQGHFQTFLDEWTALPNGYVFSGGDYGPLFRGSDALVTDGISWLIEYQLMRKPLIYIEREGHDPFNPVGEIARSGFVTVRSAAEAREVAERIFATGDDPAREGRADVLAKLIPPGDPVSNILEALRASFGLR